jgi:hypothetical protein
LGDLGLKVDDSRKVVLLSHNSGVGDKPPSIVLGPLDRATPEASDALLKTLEDLQEAPLRICLWADHLVGVSPTIRSRTNQKWCPPTSRYIDPLSHLEEDAAQLSAAVEGGDLCTIIRIVREAKNPAHLAEALCAPLALSGNTEAWLPLRRVLDGKGGMLALLDAILPEEV